MTKENLFFFAFPSAAYLIQTSGLKAQQLLAQGRAKRHPGYKCGR